MGYIEPKVVVIPSRQQSPLIPSGNFQTSFLGTGSILKNQEYTIKKGSADGTDIIVDSTNTPVPRRIIVDIFSIIDLHGRSYTKNVDFSLSSDGNTGNALIDWGTASPFAKEPATNTVLSPSTYTVVTSRFKEVADYTPLVFSDQSTEASWYGSSETPGVMSGAFTRSVIADSPDAIFLTSELAQLLLVADNGQYYSPELDFAASATTSQVLAGAEVDGASTSTVLKVTDTTNVASGQLLRLETGTGSAANDGQVRFITAVTPNTDITVSPAFPAVMIDNDFVVYNVKPVPTVGVNEPTAQIAPAGSFLVIDWSIAATASQEPVASAAYTTIFFTNTSNDSKSPYDISIAYEVFRLQGSTTFVGSQISPLDDGTGTNTQLITPMNRGLNGFLGATSAQLLTGFVVSLDKLFSRTDVQIIVPLVSAHKGTSDGSTVPPTPDLNELLDGIKVHCDDASSPLEGRPRWALLSAPNGTDAPSGNINNGVDIFKNTAKNLKDNRIFYINPGKNTKTFTFGDVVLDGWIMAAGVAGVNSNTAFDAGEPMSGKSVVGVEVDNLFSRFQLNQMAEAGVLIVDNENGTSKIRQFLTTDNSSFLNSEGKVTKIVDVVTLALQTNLGSLFINTRFVGQETLSQIRGAIQVILKQFAQQNIITEGAVLSVVQNPDFPNEIDVVVSIRPTPDVNIIKIQLVVAL